MDKAFLQKILTKHKTIEPFPPTSQVCKLVTRILLTLFPEQTRHLQENIEDIEKQFQLHETELTNILSSMQKHLPEDAAVIAKKFMDKIPCIHEILLTDIEAILSGDPAAKSEYEVIRTYPGIYAISFYRLAHELFLLNVPLLPRMITEFAHSKTGIDIHPGATIDSHFFIDHGTGITIGETCHIGKNVKMYQGITLGALSVSKDMASTKRHPTIEDNVVIYSGATILGGNTIVGHDTIIGGNVWLTNSLPPFSKVYHQGQNKYIGQENEIK
jgi:serine O-acetyltransferase